MTSVFRYFEHLDETSNRFAFWEIAIAGPALELRHGPVGTPGKHEVEMCASEDHARSEYAARIAEKLAAGFRECADRRLDDRTRALEDAIAADPDDESNFLVYADWIQTLGDARGGLIVAQTAAAGDPAAAERAAAYLAEHAELFLGPFAEHTGYDGALFDLGWRSGFIRRLRIAGRGQVEDFALIEDLLAHPSVRWLSELELVLTGVARSLWLTTGYVDVIARHAPAMLRALVIQGGSWGDEDDEDPPRGAWPLVRLWPALSGLRRLVLRGGGVAVGDLALPELEHLELDAYDLLPAGLAGIANASCPSLTRLVVRVRSQSTDVEALSPIVLGKLGRQLEQLSVTGGRNTDALCRAIATLRKPSLRELELSNGTLTDDGADALAAARLPLEILDVTRNQLTYRGIARLEGAAQLVIAEQQRPRY